MSRKLPSTLRILLNTAPLAGLLVLSACKNPAGDDPGRRKPPLHDDFTPRDSPIEVAGNSIHICTPFGSPTKVSDYEWTAPWQDARTFTFEGIGGEQTINVPDATWAIHVVNKAGEREVTVRLERRGDAVKIKSMDKLVLTHSGTAVKVACERHADCDQVKRIHYEITASPPDNTCEKAHPGDGRCRVLIGAPRSGTYDCTIP